MPSYLVETYSPHSRAAADRVAMLVAGATEGVRHVRATFVPADEMCFHLVEAPSIDTLREALRRAGVAYERVVEAFE